MRKNKNGKGKGKKGGSNARPQEQLSLPDAPDVQTPAPEVDPNPEEEAVGEEPKGLGESAA